MEEIFQIQLHKDVDTPLYQQLAEAILTLISDGYLPANRKLPPIRKMAQHFGVNSVTIVNAYKYLFPRRQRHLCFAPARGAYPGTCGK